MIKNTTVLCVTLLLVFCNTSAVSSEVSTMAAPKWAGFYAGANAGGVWSANTKTSILSSFVPGSQNPSYPDGATYTGIQSASGATGTISTRNAGFIGGGQIGYNLQFTDHLFAGLETDLQAMTSGDDSGKTSNTAPLVGIYDGGAYSFLPGEAYATTLNSNKHTNYLGTFRGRLGGLITPSLLVMGTGGLAYGGVSSKATITQTNNERSLVDPALAQFTLEPQTITSGRYSKNIRLGWTVGAGGEWMFLPDWSAKVEYLYYDLGRVNYTMSPTVTRIPANPSPVAVVSSQVTTHFNGNIVHLGISYHGFS
ncbi:TPA: outer membrane protein [Legionella feeleii]